MTESRKADFTALFFCLYGRHKNTRHGKPVVQKIADKAFRLRGEKRLAFMFNFVCANAERHLAAEIGTSRAALKKQRAL